MNTLFDCLFSPLIFLSVLWRCPHLLPQLRRLIARNSSAHRHVTQETAITARTEQSAGSFATSEAQGRPILLRKGIEGLMQLSFWASTAPAACIIGLIMTQHTVVLGERHERRRPREHCCVRLSRAAKSKNLEL